MFGLVDKRSFVGVELGKLFIAGRLSIEMNRHISSSHGGLGPVNSLLAEQNRDYSPFGSFTYWTVKRFEFWLVIFLTKAGGCRLRWPVETLQLDRCLIL